MEKAGVGACVISTWIVEYASIPYIKIWELLAALGILGKEQAGMALGRCTKLVGFLVVRHTMTGAPWRYVFQYLFTFNFL